jgi:large subunit ribosomal protein L17
MRHLKRTVKLGRTAEHRNAMLANLVCSLIKHRRVTTTLAKAKAARPLAEQLVTLGKRGTIHARRLAAARLRVAPRTFFRGSPKHKGAEKRKAWREQHDVVHILFDKIAPMFKDRPGGYTRIVKLDRRQGDAAPLAILEWVEEPVAATTAAASEAKPAEQPKT